MTTTAAPPTDGNAPPRSQDGAELVITGEAVALELRPATVVHRLLSGMIDLGVYSMVAVMLLLLISRLAVDEATFAIVVVVVLATMMVVMPTFVETTTRGLSVGKLAVGIRVVRDDGGPIRFRHALVRAIIGIIEIWATVGGLATATAIVNSRSKRIGDIFAGTYSIRERGTESAMAPLLMPPELSRWAELADIRRLPDQLALHGRIFLSRNTKLKPDVRARVGRAFAAAIEPYVSPPPPWGTHPERFLAAVLVARRDREYWTGLAAEQRDEINAERTRRLPFGIPEVN